MQKKNFNRCERIDECNDETIVSDWLDIALDTNKKVGNYLGDLNISMRNFYIEQNGNVVCTDSRVENGEISSISAFITCPYFDLKYVKDDNLRKKIERLQICDCCVRDVGDKIWGSGEYASDENKE